MGQCVSTWFASISRGRKPSEVELRTAVGVYGDVRTHFEGFTDGRSVHKAVCIDGIKAIKLSCTASLNMYGSIVEHRQRECTGGSDDDAAQNETRDSYCSNQYSPRLLALL